MFDCVFNDWLQDQTWNLGKKQFFGDIHAQLESLGKPYFLDVQILLQKVHFLSQRHLFTAGLRCDAAQKITQSCNHAHCVVVSVFAYKSGDGIKGIKQKVWLDLPTQGLELCLGELFVEPRGLGLLARKPLARIENIADREDCGI